MTTEATVIGAVAQQAMDPIAVVPSEVYSIADGNGGVKFLDTDAWGHRPRSAIAERTVTDSESFVKYVEKHGNDGHTEVYADKARSSVVAIIDSHGTGNEPGWQKHKVTLKLEHTPSWLAWQKFNNVMMSQSDFAEFVEQRATDVVTPAAGDLMELAQKMQMTVGVEFESAQRLSDGQTHLVYKEKTETKGNGNMDVPKELLLALQPYVGSGRQYAYAAFRTRLVSKELRVGYVLVRPEEILEGVFADMVAEIVAGRPTYEAAEATATKPAVTARAGFAGITAPIFYGRP